VPVVAVVKQRSKPEIFPLLNRRDELCGLNQPTLRKFRMALGDIRPCPREVALGFLTVLTRKPARLSDRKPRGRAAREAFAQADTLPACWSLCRNG